MLSALADSTSHFDTQTTRGPDEFTSRAMPRNASRTRNEIKTALLLGVTNGVIVGAGSLLGRTALYVGLLIAIGVNAYAYFNSDRLTLRTMRARPVSEAEQPAMYRIVGELSQSLDQPVPRLYVSPTKAPNAFTTGRTSRHAAVCCTTGILELLDERELRAVLGIELARIHNGDTQLLSLTGTLAAGITVVGLLPSLTAPFTASDDDSTSHVVSILSLALLGPLAALVVRAVVRRSDERRADAAGAALTGDPLALASALRKLERATRAAPLYPEPSLVARSHLMLVSPFLRHEAWGRLFDRRTPIPERITHLERLGHADA